MKTTLALVLGASGAGAVSGFVFGVGWLVARVGPMDPRVAGTILLSASALDVAAARNPRWRPLAVRSQVPREWTALLPLPTAAALYGARLGVGPFTLLPTWLWWAAAVIAASAGVGVSVAVGLAFGLVRAATIVVASAIVQGAMPARMARLRSAAAAVSFGLGSAVGCLGLLAVVA